LKSKEQNKKALEDQLKNTKEKGEIEVIKNKIDVISSEITEVTNIVTTYTSTVNTYTTEITNIESGKTTTEYESEIKTLEEDLKRTTESAQEELKQLPLIKEETDAGKKGTSSTTPSPEQTHPGVIKGITIKGDIGGTSTTTGTTDISTQIIEKEETATKLREEATRMKEVATS
jgi:chromosome segregation ATPase